MVQTVHSVFEKFRCSAVFLEKIIDTTGTHTHTSQYHTQNYERWGVGRSSAKEKKKTKVGLICEDIFQLYVAYADWKNLYDGPGGFCATRICIKIYHTYGVFAKATTDNALAVLREAVIQHGRPASILTDHDSS